MPLNDKERPTSTAKGQRNSIPTRARFPVSEASSITRLAEAQRQMMLRLWKGLAGTLQKCRSNLSVKAQTRKLRLTR